MAILDHAIDTPPRAPSPVHRFGTLAVHAGSPHDPATGAVIESVGSFAAFSTHSSLLIAVRSPSLLHMLKRVLGNQWEHMSIPEAQTPTGRSISMLSLYGI